MATLDQVLSQMAAAGMPPLPSGHPVPTGRIVRFGPKKKCWYVLHEYAARNGQRYLYGAFGRWQGLDPQTFKIESDATGMDPAEAERLARSQAELRSREEAKRAQRARFAANRAAAQWSSARAAGESPYLKRKGVEPEKGLRFLPDGTLIVPMIRYDVTEEAGKDPAPDAPRRLVGLQKIAPDGSKRFNAGMSKAGAAVRLGKRPVDGDVILLTEGVATALSIRQALDRTRPVFVAFDAGNLEPVAKILRALYPASPMLICADDDAYLEARMSRLLAEGYGVATPIPVPRETRELEGEGGPVKLTANWERDADGVWLITGAVSRAGKAETFVLQNAGLTKAHAAARAVGNSQVCAPEFVARAMSPDPDGVKRTDFNDLHEAEGIERVRVQIEAAIAAFGTEGAAEASPQAKKKRGTRGAAGGEAPPGEPDWPEFWGLVRRFTYVYPTDTAYDHDLGDFVKIEHMRLKFGARYVSLWLHSKHRKEVDLPHVVFDPGNQVSGAKLNLFRGLAVEPNGEGTCGKWLELLFCLCGEDDNCFVWVLKWLAYPLQHLGAKMQTALVFSGKEGAGKNLVFGAVRDIYGVHAGIITQRQLENDFNLWLSAKLFLIANEVVTRAEMRHHVGFLKNLITEPEIWINRKNKDERCEQNHCNLVFFSNELQPLQISPDDRRYMIVRTPPAQVSTLYAEVVAELANGGLEALHHYLRTLDLGDFGPHTKPPMTAAKRDLIEMGLNGPQLFQQDLHDGDLGLPYGPARVQDVYRAYVAWAKRNGDKVPARINVFVPHFMSMNGVQRVRTRVPTIGRVGGELSIDKKERAPAKVLVMGEPPPGNDRDEWIAEGVVKFAVAADTYCNERV